MENYYKRSHIYNSSSPELIVGSLSVCLIVCVSGHFTTLHLSTYRNRKWNRSHNDRSPRLCVSPRRRPHVTAVCPTVVCKFLYYIIILLIIYYLLFLLALFIIIHYYIPDSWVIASGAAKNFCARAQWWDTLQKKSTVVFFFHSPSRWGQRSPLNPARECTCKTERNACHPLQFASMKLAQWFFAVFAVTS